MPAKTDKGTLRPVPPRDDQAFLGEEFLTWLWFRAESGEAEFDFGQGNVVGVSLDAPVVLRAVSSGLDTPRPEQVLRHGEPLRGPEAAAALRRGKRLTRARLVVGTPEREWNLTFDAEAFSPRGIRVPEPEEPVNPDERPLAQMLAFEELTEILDKLFKAFLEERLTPAFREKTVPRMREWAAGK
jgi:hypothetical protein